jgi:membrane protease YdiL (CAAX protease family)
MLDNPPIFWARSCPSCHNKQKNGAPIKTVLFSTIFQLVYTTLFGAYASYCYIKIGSLPAIVILHSFCNFMGLPDVSLLFGFVQGGGDAESLQRSRILSGIAYIAGIASFWVCFGLFPYEELLLVTT